MKQFVAPPRLVANRQPTERHATWLELFYDLVFAVAIARLSERLDGDASALGFLQFLGLFMAVWWAWIGQIVYLTRFDTDDLIHRLITFTLMLGAAVMSIQIKNAFEGGSIGFVLAYVFLRLTLLFMYARAWLAVPEVRSVANVYLVGFSVGVAFWLVSLLIPTPYQYIFWGIGLAVDLVTPWLRQRTLKQIPVDSSHLPERLAQFNIIVLGEAITQAIDGLAKVQWGWEAVTVAVLSFGLAVIIWWKYFTFYERADLGKNLGPGQALIYSHLPFIIGLTLIGVGAKQAILEATAPQLTLPTLALLCGGVAVWAGATLLIQWVTHRREPPKGLFFGHLAEVGVALLIGLVGLWVMPPIVLTLLVISTLGLLAVQLRYATRLRQPEQEHTDHQLATAGEQ